MTEGIHSVTILSATERSIRRPGCGQTAWISEGTFLTISRRSDNNGHSLAIVDDVSSGGILFHGTWNSAMDNEANG